MSLLPYKCLNCGAERESDAVVLCPSCGAAMLEPISTEERIRLRQEFVEFANKAMAEVDKREFFKTVLERAVADGWTKGDRRAVCGRRVDGTPVGEGRSSLGFVQVKREGDSIRVFPMLEEVR